MKFMVSGVGWGKFSDFSFLLLFFELVNIEWLRLENFETPTLSSFSIELEGWLLST